MDNRKLAKKGRGGDTHIRDVYGIKSHVNKLEADIIDSYGLLGESLVVSTGSGTINPQTGLPEYYGAEDLSAEDFMDMNETQVMKWVFANIYDNKSPHDMDASGGDIDQTDHSLFMDWIGDQLETKMPQLQPVAQEEKNFLAKEKQLAKGAAGRAYQAAGLGFEQAGITREGAKEAYEIGVSGAERQKETMLGGLQEEAYQVGAPATTAAGMRGQMRGKKKVKKGFETGMGKFADVMKGVEGKKERAEDVYGIAGKRYLLAGDVKTAAEERADLVFDRGEYGLEQKQESKFNTEWKSFLGQLQSATP